MPLALNLQDSLDSIVFLPDYRMTKTALLSNPLCYASGGKGNMSMPLILFQLLIGSLVRTLQEEQVKSVLQVSSCCLNPPRHAAPAHARGKGLGEQACGHTPILLPLPRVKPLSFMPLLFQRNAACLLVGNRSGTDQEAWVPCSW